MALSEYTQLEYIESTGTQYIDTNFKPNQDTTCEVSLYKNTNNSCRIFGAWSTSYHENTFSIGTDGTDNSYIGYDSQYDGSDNGKKIPTIPNGNHIVGLYKNVYKLDGNIIKTYNYQNFNCTKSIYLFVQHTHNEALEQYGAYRLYYCKIWNNDTLVRNFIPVKRKSDNVLGLYDIVNDKFYINKGSGSFIAGPNKYDGSQLQQNLLEIREELNTELDTLHSVFGAFINPYTKLEYIESTGTQWIDTLQKGNSNTTIELKLYNSYTSSTEKAVLGSRTFPRSNCLMIGFNSNGWVCYNNGEGTFANILNKVTSLKLVKNNMYVLNSSTQQYELVKTYNSGSFTTPSNMILFGERRDNDVTQLSSIKVYYLKIYDGNVLVRDFIPVKRDEDNVICMYDKVTKQFFTNQGTGIFIAGPEVN